MPTHSYFQIRLCSGFCLCCSKLVLPTGMQLCSSCNPSCCGTSARSLYPKILWFVTFQCKMLEIIWRLYQNLREINFLSSLVGRGTACLTTGPEAMWGAVAAIRRLSKILFYFAFPLITGLLIQPLYYCQIFFFKFHFRGISLFSPKREARNELTVFV